MYNSPFPRFLEFLLLLFTDYEPPKVVSCPNVTKVVVPERVLPVTWIEPIFTDNKMVTSITKSHIPGVAMSWGDYVVTYVATDASGNTATCTFELYVIRKFTPFAASSRFLLSSSLGSIVFNCWAPSG